MNEDTQEIIIVISTIGNELNKLIATLVEGGNKRVELVMEACKECDNDNLKALMETELAAQDNSLDAIKTMHGKTLDYLSSTVEKILPVVVQAQAMANQPVDKTPMERDLNNQVINLQSQVRTLRSKVGTIEECTNQTLDNIGNLNDKLVDLVDHANDLEVHHEH